MSGYIYDALTVFTVIKVNARLTHPVVTYK